MTLGGDGLSGLMFVLVVPTFVAIVVAVAMLVEPAWIGSLIKPFVIAAIPIAAAGIVLALLA